MGKLSQWGKGGLNSDLNSDKAEFYDSDVQSARAMAGRLKIPFVDLEHAFIEPSAIARLAPESAFKRQALPIRMVNDRLLVAMHSPDQPVAVRSLELLTGMPILPAVAPKGSLGASLKKYYGNENRGIIVKDLTRPRAAKPATQPGLEKPAAKNISIISNKGGVGKTHLSINLAFAFAEAGKKVLLIDADLGNADISNKLGLFPKNHLMGFLEKKNDLNDLKALIAPTPFGFDLIAGTYGEFRLRF